MRAAAALEPHNAVVWSGLGVVCAHERDEQYDALRRAAQLDKQVRSFISFAALLLSLCVAVIACLSRMSMHGTTLVTPIC